MNAQRLGATIPFQVSTGGGAETDAGAGPVTSPTLATDVPPPTPNETPTPTAEERLQKWWAEQSRSLLLLVAALGTLTMLVITLTAFVTRQSRTAGHKPDPTVPEGKNPRTRPANAPAMLQAEGDLPGAPRQIKLDRETIVIGRNRAVVDEEIADDRVSNRHCTVRRENARYTVEDHGATNGTWINDNPVTDTPVELKPGDILKIGPASYRFVVSANVRSSTPALRGENGLPYVHTRKLSNQPGLSKEGEQ